MGSLKLSARSVTLLRACENATYERPAHISHGYAHHLIDKGLLDYRMFDPKLGAGGHFITPAGRRALEEKEGQK